MDDGCGSLDLPPEDSLFVLMLNDMRQHTEDRTPVARAKTPEALEAYLERETVPAYSDRGNNQFSGSSGHEYAKVFRKDGRLEWFNSPFDIHAHIEQVPTLEAVIRIDTERWEQRVGLLPDVDV